MKRSFTPKIRERKQLTESDTDQVSQNKEQKSKALIGVPNGMGNLCPLERLRQVNWKERKVKDNVAVVGCKS